MIPERFNTCVMAVALAASASGACTKSAPEARPQNEVLVAYDALSSAIAACGDALAQCAADAAGDAAALQACRDELASCRQSAGTPAADALADAVVACTQDTGSCASEADGQAASACHEELQACLGANRPAPGGGDDEDGGPGDHAPPVAPCIDALLECVMADGDARACAHDVRACIIAHVPAPPGVIPVDPGSAAGDAGKPDDLPEPPADAGMQGDLPEPPTPDAGMGAPPASTCMDAFEECVAAGGSPASCGMHLRECNAR